MGLGRMGFPMVERLLAAGHPVRCWARRAEVVAAATAAGATPASGLADAVVDADVAVVCVYDDEQVREVCLGADGIVAAMRPGSSLVVHTTGSPVTAAELAAAGARRGIGVADAPVDGGAMDIVAGRVTVFLGADDATAAAVLPVLAAYGDPVHHVGGVGDGQRTKLVNNLLFAANARLVEEAAGLAADLGVDPAAALGAIGRGGTGRSASLDLALLSGGPAGFTERVRPFLVKDVGTCEAVAAALGAGTGALGAVARAACGPAVEPVPAVGSVPARGPGGGTPCH
ncbi:NAD(P)-dependent oxidoreductase [Trujillonella endophytica]|uniref:NAD(P)-dependent oxidoreductase n=1 Tax=Trujillonella endophytica TaxID=673521 RepID=UPI001B8BA959|nr:NAD(P)-binding domain-containing protein [Trujillella endophytica]